MKRIVDWLFRVPEEPYSPWRVVAWWEARRVPFNIIVGVCGALGVAVFLWTITTSGHLQPGEDPLEPITILAAPLVINVLYTLGWIIEVPIRRLLPGLSPCFGPVLLRLGLGLGLFVITMPAAYWTGYRLLQLIGVLS